MDSLHYGVRMVMTSITRQQTFFSPIITLWDHYHICGLLLVKILLLYLIDFTHFDYGLRHNFSGVNYIPKFIFSIHLQQNKFTSQSKWITNQRNTKKFNIRKYLDFAFLLTCLLASTTSETKQD